MSSFRHPGESLHNLEQTTNSRHDRVGWKQHVHVVSAAMYACGLSTHYYTDTVVCTAV